MGSIRSWDLRTGNFLTEKQSLYPGEIDHIYIGKSRVMISGNSQSLHSWTVPDLDYVTG